MALTSGEAPLTNESQGKCRLRLVGDGIEMVVAVSGAAFLKDGELRWSAFEAGIFEEKDSFTIKKLELVELMALTSGEAPLTNESQGKCRLRLVGDGKEMDVPFSDAERAREWMDQLMEKARCDL